MDQGLGDRLLNFAVDIVKFLRELPECKVIRYQLAKSATSSGANFEEAQAASSQADFRQKMMISLREMRESRYWLALISKAEFSPIDSKGESLLKESKELMNILGAICSKLKVKN